MQRLPLVGRHQHGGGVPVPGDLELLVRGLHLLDQRGELILGLAQWDGLHEDCLAELPARIEGARFPYRSDEFYWSTRFGNGSRDFAPGGQQ